MWCIVFFLGMPSTRSAGTRSAGASPYKRINSTPATPAKYNYSPFRVGLFYFYTYFLDCKTDLKFTNVWINTGPFSFQPSTVMTNVSRGNVRTTTPCIMPSKSNCLLDRYWDICCVHMHSRSFFAAAMVTLYNSEMMPKFALKF